MQSHSAVRFGSALSVLALSFLAASPRMPARSSGVSAQGSPAAAQEVTVALTTDPSPAHKGTNTVRVNLTDSKGQPVVGAEVTVTFLMAAMPTMNMPEVKAVIKGADKGAGTYEGKAELSSGGTWQVTVTASKAGQTIATKKLTIKATGGM